MIFVIPLSGCSVDVSVEHLAEKFKIFSSKGGEGITSGSGQMKKDLTSGNYKVSSSVGVVGGTNTVNNSLYHQTQSGYKVFSTVQGAIVSQ
ncbi:MAG: hypothetical protein ACXWRZ_02775 [Bdellovibrio sp.]